MHTISSTETTVYHVRVVGNIWQPGVECATKIVVTQPMEYPQADGESDLDYEIRMVQCAADHQLGDFREVTGWEIDRETTERTEHLSMAEGLRVTTTVTTKNLLGFDWSELDRFTAAMYGSEDDE